ncbi:unnamed protein product [Parascedosporium putredinis]|uniref:SnoaL-like domain-containing protein n=1 Tax=Parascedosporium putredinis TaxID=1442378 RepID=A0A9P1M835_9PEZI|nr:unnamed protein product [Parascedosporium putredinis]CAI7991809.1 unnamed protein product [Parascedosporium putredinis]
MRLPTALLVLGLGLSASPAAASPLTSLARDVARLESVRAIKDVQKSFAQLAQFGQWRAMADLFAAEGEVRWGRGGTLDLADADVVRGPNAVEEWLRADAGAMDGAGAGSLNAHLTEEPLVSLAENGTFARARWQVLRLMGDGAGATRIQGGVYENEYVWDAGAGLGQCRAGITIPLEADAEGEDDEIDVDEIAYRIDQLNDEDQVRNLQHSYGYYVDQRLWTHVVDLIRAVLEEWMGAENLTEGILNEYPMFDVMVEVDPDGRSATARGLEIGMIGDTSKKQGKWEFNVFRNTFVKDEETGLWKIKTLGITRLIHAPGEWRARAIPDAYNPSLSTEPSNTTAADRVQVLRNRYAQSSAFDETENVGSAYGYFADDIRCQHFADLHAACLARYNTNTPNPQRPNVPYHWRLQPVILASPDGRSTSMRTKLLQFGTSSGSKGGFTGVWGFNGGMYHDHWKDGWAASQRRSKREEEEDGGSVQQHEQQKIAPRQGGGLASYPPDVDLKDPKLGEREAGLPGGPTATVVYPQILPMWFSYRNPVSGRLPYHYWGPGCVPCRGAKPEWALTANGYQEPPMGPTLVGASWEGDDLVVMVGVGPEEADAGIVELRAVDEDGGSVLVDSAALSGGNAVFSVAEEVRVREDAELVAVYLGNDNVRPGRAKAKSWAAVV